MICFLLFRLELGAKLSLVLFIFVLHLGLFSACGLQDQFELVLCTKSISVAARKIGALITLKICWTKFDSEWMYFEPFFSFFLHEVHVNKLFSFFCIHFKYPMIYQQKSAKSLPAI